MALVEVARFLELTEAQAAAAALRASEIPVFVQNENWGRAGLRGGHPAPPEQIGERRSKRRP